MQSKATNHENSRTWKEITSQGSVWQTVLNELSASKELQETLESSSKRRNWIFAGCGTSYYLAEAAAFTWTKLTGQPARAIPSSEALLFPEIIRCDWTDIQAVAISRSGQTSETVRAAGVFQELRIPTIGITCSANSELHKVCDRSITLTAADEESTVMTRSFTSMLLALQVLAARRGNKPEFIADLQRATAQFAPRLHDLAHSIEAFVAKHSFADFVFLGQGAFHGIAREASLKVMEMSCSYSQFFHTLEFRHGPKAIVSPATCLTFFLSATGQQAETEVLAEMRELGGTTIAISGNGNEAARSAAELAIELHFDGHELALLAPFIVPAQILGFFTAIRKGLNPDEPKNLTRVVLLD
jgi:glutamine---fructose-6-phosphate transaminase (isomerizing)